MKLPAYTELSNFTVRKGGQKAKADLTIAIILNQFSDPVETLNSVYRFVSETKKICEVLFLNTDKEGYRYDRLLDTFPAFRVLLPQEEISLPQAVALIAQESLSRYCLFLNEDVELSKLDLDLLDVYLSQNSLGMLVPEVIGSEGEEIPSVVKASIERGFLETMSFKMKGTAIPSLYPKYFAFILNKEMFEKLGIEISDFQTLPFSLLDLGYKTWRHGFLIFQSSNFRVKLLKEETPDIRFNADNDDYLSFMLQNFTEKNEKHLCKRKIRSLALKSIVTLKWKNASRLFKALSASHREKTIPYPVDNPTLFSTINKDIE